MITKSADDVLKSVDLITMVRIFVTVWHLYFFENFNPTRGLALPNPYPRHLQIRPARPGPNRPPEFDRPGGPESSVSSNRFFMDNLFMDELARQLRPDYLEFQETYWSESLPKRYSLNNYSRAKFEYLAKNPKSKVEGYTQKPIDETIAIMQAESENIFCGASRPNKETAKEMGLDFLVLRPHPYTNVKQAVGLEILLKQGQDVDIKKIAYKIGEKLVE